MTPLWDNPAIEAHSHLSELDLADLSGDGGELAINVLIASYHYWKLVTGEVIYQDNCPTAVKTLLGWVLSGPIEGLTENLFLTNYTSTHALELESHLISYEDSSQYLETRLKRFWDFKTLGIRESEDNIYDKFVNNMSFKNGLSMLMMLNMDQVMLKRLINSTLVPRTDWVREDST